MHQDTLSAYPRVEMGWERNIPKLQQLHTVATAASLTLYKPLSTLATLFQEPKTWFPVIAGLNGPASAAPADITQKGGGRGLRPSRPP